MRLEKVHVLMPATEMVRANWPGRSKRIVAPAVEAEINRRGAHIARFIAKRGDVLFRHERLLHRGTPTAMR
jgi:hypothetical protein